MSEDIALEARSPGGRGKQTAASRPLRQGPMWKTLFVFLIPLMLSNALQSIGGAISSVLLGQFIGVDALAAGSAVFPVVFFLISFMIGIGSGSSVLIGQAYGAGRMDRVKAVAGTSLTFTFLVGIALAVAGGICTHTVLTWMGTPANILASATGYARIFFYAMPILFVYAVYTTFMRGIGDSRTPFYFLVVSTGLSLLLTPTFIFGWVGLPRLGLYGAAWSNVLATLVTFVLMLGYLHVRRHPLRLDREIVAGLKIDAGILGQLLRIGLPTGVQMVMVSLSEIAIVTLVNRYGSDATAAYGAYYQVANYVQMPAVSIGIAVSIFGAQVIGAGRPEQLRQVIRSGVLLNYVVGGVLVILCYLFARDILSWFLTNEHTLTMAYQLLMITLWSYLIFGNGQVFSGIMRASGTVVWPTVLSVISIWCVEIPVAYVLSAHIGIDGVWLGYCAAFVVGLLLLYGYYRWFWRRKEHKRLIA
nr:MATE family efflux transporter [Alicyclobacillus shizuokensis]